MQRPSTKKNFFVYPGILEDINPTTATIALAHVRSFGTEGRPAAKFVPPSSEVYDFIKFRGSDIKDLKVEVANEDGKESGA